MTSSQFRDKGEPKDKNTKNSLKAVDNPEEEAQKSPGYFKFPKWEYQKWVQVKKDFGEGHSPIDKMEGQFIFLVFEVGLNLIKSYCKSFETNFELFLHLLQKVPSTLFSTECTEYCDTCDTKNISLMMAIHDTFPDQGRRNPVMIRPNIKVRIEIIFQRIIFLHISLN